MENQKATTWTAGQDGIMITDPRQLQVRLVDEIEPGKWIVYRHMDRTLHPFAVSVLELRAEESR